ncbi:ankyrin repeat domain-containing protein [Oceanomicrobium pacificus]|uniref:Ankyrin repeat domain-containing protein n=1 Tax=Oceanomicrobium pacificus TaxID=2692916 RepID=A0A6B0TVD7_9RHOB|nr:ankyrin repeat domain-containing protein [Oceanomicrobium pacificus]MXU65182.1 ankyrin repeat domain-containing protein [Oceanomicrobium pacificus]
MSAAERLDRLRDAAAERADGADAEAYAAALEEVARAEGAASWAQLAADARVSDMEPASLPEALKYALFLGRPEMVDALLARDPALGRADFGLTVALGLRADVERVLKDDPKAATRIVGIRSPILHLAFSRHAQARPDVLPDMLAIAERLVAAGADVNDSYPFQPGSDERLPALYGALCHADNLPLARWLLDQGATPDDGESLYHSTELPHLDGLRLLLRHKARPEGTNALLRALDFDRIEAVELLLEHGADPDAGRGGDIPDFPALHQAARRGRGAEFATLLVSNGADPTRLHDGQSAATMARIHGNRRFARALAGLAPPPEAGSAAARLVAVAEGNGAARADLTDLSRGGPAEGLVTRLAALPDARDLMGRYLDAGLAHDETDDMGLSPVQIAGWNGLAGHVADLLDRGPGLMRVNLFGGGLVDTILHGAENCPDAEGRDHAACLSVALGAGAPVYEDELAAPIPEHLRRVIRTALDRNPDQLRPKAERPEPGSSG